MNDLPHPDKILRKHKKYREHMAMIKKAKYFHELPPSKELKRWDTVLFWEYIRLLLEKSKKK